MSQLTVSSINDIFSLYQKYGDKGYIGESITQLEHATQAAIGAEKEIYFNHPELVIAAFLHDIGHLLCYQDDTLELMGEYGVKNHESVGQEYLQDKGFPQVICQLVGGHVATKRYLISNDDSYFNHLSNASKETYKRQGGKMTSQEIETFEKDSLYMFHLKMREFDDKAKLDDQATLNFIKELNPVEYFRLFTIKTLLNIVKK